MTQTDDRLSELMARLTALERERAEIVAEIKALRSLQNERTAAVKMVPSVWAGDPTSRNSPIERLLCFAGFSAAAQMSARDLFSDRAVTPNEPAYVSRGPLTDQASASRQCHSHFKFDELAQLGLAKALCRGAVLRGHFGTAVSTGQSRNRRK